MVQRETFARLTAPERNPHRELQNGGAMLLINTRVWLNQLSEQAGRKMTLVDVPKAEWDRLSSSYDALYLMGIYQPSEASVQNARQYKYEYQDALPGVKDEDVKASPFATVGYQPNSDIARNWREWDGVVENEIHKRGMKVIIDFIPNHVGLDHPWVIEHPEYFIHGTQEQYDENLYWAHRKGEVALFDPRQFRDRQGNIFHLARGKDPNYPAWTDTLQLNYAKPEVQEAMIGEVSGLAKHADGVRCDMAMLLNSETFNRTWGHLLTSEERRTMGESNFWRKATNRARQVKKDFVFMAEAYWDQGRLIHDGFNFTYAKSELYDKLDDLLHGRSRPQWIADYIKFDPYLAHRVNFIENHDEDRAIRKFGEVPSKAFATLMAFMEKGIWMVHQGQEEGQRIKIPMQISRTRRETPMQDLHNFYQRLHNWRNADAFRVGQRSTPPHFSADGQNTYHNIVVQQGDISGGERLIACTNISGSVSHCKVMVPRGAKVEVFDLSTGQKVQHPASLEPYGDSLVEYIKLEPWSSQIVVCTQ